MKQCINPVIRAHLVPRAFYLILLVAVCVIPFALGQRATTKQSAVAAPLLLGSGPLATLSTGDDPTSGTWTVTGSLNTARSLHTATLLPNGMVLVAGGFDRTSTASASAELYDPASETWTVTGNLNTARALHTATLLPSGMCLVAGGHDGPTFAPSFEVLSSAELYDPASGTWTVTGSLNTARYLHTATLLPNGMVLVAAGENSSFSADASAELYTPGPTPTPTPTPRATPRPRPTPHPRPTPPFTPTPTATPIATPTPTPTVTATPTPTAAPQSLAAWEKARYRPQSAHGD